MANPDNPQSYDSPGEYRLHYIRIKNYRGQEIDVTKLFEGIEIYEDLFNTSLSGVITILDSLDLQQFLPFIGQETLTVSFRTHDSMDKVKASFTIYSIGERVQLTEGATAYRLRFCSDELLANETRRVSKSYHNKSVSLMVTDLIRSELLSDKPLEVNATQGTQNYIPSNVSPFYAINTLIPRAVHPDYPKGSAFVFYEDLDGFKFVSLEKMFEQTPIEYTFKHKMAIDDGTASDFFSINSYRHDDQQNSLDNIMKGVLGSKTHGFDPVTKQFKTTDFDYARDYPNISHLEGSSPRKRMFKDGYRFLDEPKNSVVNFVTTSSFRLDSDYFSSHSSMAEYPSKQKYEHNSTRLSQMNQYTNTVRMTVEVPGNSDLRVGQILTLTVPSARATEVDEREMKDQFLSGKYLVTSIKHQLDKTRYTTTMELTKDSFRRDHEEMRNEELFG